MSSFQEFEQAIRDTLPNLYDPGFRLPEPLLAWAGHQAQDGLEAVQAEILAAIDALQPPSSAPASARCWRVYEILSLRYTQQLTQEEAAERLGITPRHLRREQRDAISTLARHLWKQRKGRMISAGESQPEDAAEAGLVEWRSQVKQELAALQKSAPGSVADVGEAIKGVVELVRPLATTSGVVMEPGSVAPNLVAAIHPSELRQLLVTCITRLIRNMSSGRIELGAYRKADSVEVSITGSPVAVRDPTHDYLTRAVLALEGGTILASSSGDAVSFSLSLPAGDRVTVLVVDDNDDLVHFYERYVTGTRYNIVAVSQGQGTLDAVADISPDIIVLDVMLPDVDGWDLLVQLHEHPLARSIPVIVCSVVKEEELSLALGARLCVPKPVRRQEFIQALDLVLSQVAAEAP